MSDTPKHTPGPLRVEYLSIDPRQARIVSDYSLIDGSFEDTYLDFSGYYGSYGPHMFAAAPEMLDALKRLVDTVWFDRLDTELILAVEHAIAKAEGRQG
jgi:hypothetical protein